MRVLLALVLVALALGVFWWFVRDTRWKPVAVPPAEPVDAPAPVPAAPTDHPVAPEPETGFLVVRVRTKDGTPLPAATQAGFERLGDLRLRAVGGDGSARFPDAPLGRVQATAEAEGYVAIPVSVVVLAGVPAEAVVLLAPREK